MTLLTACQNVLNEIGTHEVPDTIVGNSNPTAKQILAIANQVGKYFSRKHDLTDLLVDYTFNTADGTASYALPTGFRKFANITFWDNANDWQMIGPVSRAGWQRLNSSNIVGSTRRYFRIAGGSFYIFPTPSTVDEIAYQYFSDYWCESSGGTGQSAWAADTDLGVIDEYWMEREIKWRFLQAKGLPYEDEKQEAIDIRSAHMANDGAKPVLNMGGQRLGILGTNIPETGYGSS